MPGRDAPYEPHAMRRLLRPASVALVGASGNPRAIGGRTLANLAGFPGRLYRVNPNQTDIGGHACFPDVAHLPETVDCVVVAVPAAGTEAVVRQCAAAGVGGVIVLASGYAETGTVAGQEAQARLRQLATQADMRLVGPNCVGVASLGDGFHGAFAEFPHGETVPGCRVGLVSQSGALGLALSQAADRGISFGHVLTCGNSCDVDVADFVAYLAEAPDCDAIALAYEGLEDPGRLRQAIQRATQRGKRVAWCRLGTSVAGRDAIRHHTATGDLGSAQPGEAGGWPGVCEVRAIEGLVDTAAFLAKAPAPRAGGVAVLSGSGGTGILAVDAAERAGVPTPQPGADTAAVLAAALPEFASPRNPCDATAQATRNPESMLACAAALLADPRFAALVIPWGRSQTPTLLPAIGELGRRDGKPVCVVWMSQSLQTETTLATERNPALAQFRSLDHCFSALAAWRRRDAVDPAPTRRT